MQYFQSWNSATPASPISAEKEGGRLLAQETVGDQNMATAFFQLARDTDIYM